MRGAWRLIVEGHSDAAWNMAVDEAILESLTGGAPAPTVRFYRWAGPSISLGRFQRAERVVDLALCRERKVQVVQRLTGGKAVLHGHDLTLCIVAPLQCFAPAHRVVDVHLRIVQALARGFRMLGIETHPVSRADLSARWETHANCFERALPGDLISPNGVKLVGGAQYRRAGVVMEQMSIPFETLPGALRGCLLPWAEPAPSPLLGIKQDDLLGALCEGIRCEFAITTQPASLHPREIEMARCLHRGYLRV